MTPAIGQVSAASLVAKALDPTVFDETAPETAALHHESPWDRFWQPHSRQSGLGGGLGFYRRPRYPSPESVGRGRWVCIAGQHPGAQSALALYPGAEYSGWRI